MVPTGQPIEQDRVAWDIRTSDLRQFNSRVSHCLKPYRFLSTATGGYDAAAFRRRLANLNLLIIRYGNEVTIDAGRLHHLPLLQIPLTGSYRVHLNGRSAEVPTRTAHLLPASSSLVMEWSADCLLLVFRLDHGMMTAGDAVTSTLGRTRTEFGSFAPLEKAASLAHIVDFVTAEAVSDGILMTSPKLAAMSEELLMSVLPGAFARADEPPTSFQNPWLAAAEGHIRQNLFDETLSVEDIAAACGSGSRTVYRLFRRAHGKGPLAWARDLRLDLARYCLLETGSENQSVTDVATAHNFDHFGRFAALYQMRYGELPSETLRRRRIEQSARPSQ